MKKDEKKLVILSSVSGAGKTTTMFAFEEMHFAIIGNLPPYLFDTFLKNHESDKNKTNKTFVSIHLSDLGAMLEELKKHPNLSYDLILLTASKQEILNRYKFTRHAHPLQVKGVELEDVLDKEYKYYEKYKSKATIRLDTTDIDVASLRKTFFMRYRDEEKAPVILTFVSFGYKHGIPRDADMIFDVRSIPNPYYDEKLRNLTGEDKEVIAFLTKHKETEKYQKLICDFLDKYINDSLKENRALINVAIGCTGGQHRSVYFVNYLANHYASKVQTLVIHRDKKKR